MARTRLIAIGDTTFASDPLKQHKSYKVYTSKTGKRFYTLIRGVWYLAHPVYPTGFKVGQKAKSQYSFLV